MLLESLTIPITKECKLEVDGGLCITLEAEVEE